MEAPGEGPYATTFVLTNNSDKPIYLWEDCTLDVAITSCASGYSTPLAIGAICMQDCANVSPGGNNCGPCADQPVEVAAGAKQEFKWEGYTFTFSEKNGQSCYNIASAPAGKYRFEVKVWDAKPIANGPKPEPSRKVLADFDLTGAEVVVPLVP